MSACSITPDYLDLTRLYLQSQNYSELVDNIFQSDSDGYFYNIEEIANTIDKEINEYFRKSIKGGEIPPFISSLIEKFNLNPGESPFSKYALIAEFNNKFSNNKVKSANEFFSKPFSELYLNGDESLKYMYNNFERNLVRLAFIDDSPIASYSDAITIDNVSLNNKIHNYKNSIFKDLYNYVKDNNLLEYNEIPYQDLYVDNKFVGKDLYQKVMQDISDLFSGYSTNVKLYNELESAKLDLFNKAVVLSRFDDILGSKFSNIISINTYNKGHLGESINAFHYFLEFKGTKSEYWSKDTHEANSAENYTSSFMKMIAGTIPLLDANGIVIKNQFLGMDRVYLIASNIKQLNIDRLDLYNFQDNPKKYLRFYLDTIRKMENLEIQGAIESLYNYLYGSSNVVEKIDLAKQFNADIAPSLIDIEAIIAHQINNIIGKKYGKYTTDPEGEKVILSLVGKATKEGEVMDGIIRHISYSLEEFENLRIKDDGKVTYKGSKIELGKLIELLTGIDLNPSAKAYLRKTAKASKDNNLENNITNIFLNSIQVFKDVHSLYLNSDKYKDFLTKSRELLSSNDNVKTLVTATISSINPEALMSFKNEKGDLIPTVGQSNLAHETKTSFDIAKTEFGTKGLFLLENNLIKGVEVLLEIVTEPGKSVDPFYLNPEENLFLNFTENYLNKLISNKDIETYTDSDYMSVKLVNFSDKISINNELIDQNVELVFNENKLSHKDSSDKIIRSTLKNIPLKNIRNLSDTVLHSYYQKIADKIIDNYLELEDLSGKKIFKNYSVISKDGIKNTNFNKTIAGINNTLKTMSESDFEKIIYQNWIRLKNTTTPLLFTKEVSYSKYNGVMAFNKIIQGYLEKTKESFEGEKISKLAERKFIEKVKEIYPEFEFIKKSFKTKTLVTDIFNKLNLFDNTIISDAQKSIEIEKWFKFDSSMNQYNPPISKMYWFRIPVKGGYEYHTLDDSLPDLTNVEINPIFSKWLHTQNLIRFSSLGLTTKHEYQHPHKLNKINYDVMDFEKELTGRSISMTKRMVIRPGTMEFYMQGLDNGIPNKIKLAVVKDLKAISYNFTGNMKEHESWDGSLSSNPFLSFLLKNSLPNKGLSDVQKAIGHDARATHSTFLKCALFTYTNEMIRKSIGSPINLDRMMKSMNNIPIEFDIDMSKNILGNFLDLDQLVPEGIYYSLGDNTYKVEKFIKTEGNIYKIHLTNQSNLEEDVIELPINNLYDLWQVFGGAYSKSKLNGEYVYSDASIQAVGNIISLIRDSSGELILKEKMIGILAQESSVKNGATNINNTDIFNPLYDNQGNELIREIMYSDFDTHFFGIQLDASHISDDSMINEVSQVVSALAENQATPELYSELYKAISSIINDEIIKYKDKYQIYKNENGKVIRKYDLDKLSKEFVRILNNSDRKYGNATEIANLLTTKAKIHLPISNNNFFNGFVINVMSKLTSDFIKRKYPGLGAVLNPSHGMIQLYEDNEGNTYFHDDLIELATTEEKITLQTNPHKANLEITQKVIDRMFPNTEITDFSIIKPLDILELTTSTDFGPYTTIINLNSIDKYYQFKKFLVDNLDTLEKIVKINNRPRDLKPSEISFTQDGVNKNIFDNDPVRLTWVYNEGIKNPLNISESDKIILKNFVNEMVQRENLEIIIEDIFNVVNQGIIKRYLKLWNQRSFDLLANNLNYPIVNIDTNFKDLFGTDDFISKLSPDNYPNELLLNPIENYKHKEFEIVMPKVYRSEFNIENVSFAQIKLQGEYFFNKQVKEILNPKTINCDLFLASTKGDSLYVSILDQSEIDTLQKVQYPSIIDENQIFRVNIKGEKLFKVPKNAEFYYINGIETLIFNKSKGVIENEITPFVKDIKSNYEFIFPFSANISDNKSIINLVKISGDYSMIPMYKRRLVDLHKKLTNEKVVDKSNDFINLKLEFNTIKYNVAKNLAKSMYSSWQKSNIVSSARIPSQAMQSFMSMRNVGYTEDRGNNVFVSAMQLFLQGSDYDIDKAYIMMHGFKNGVYKGWSPYFNYTSIENLNLSEQLPIPNKKSYKISEYVERAVDLTNFHTLFTEQKKKYLELSDIIPLLIEVNKYPRDLIFVPNDEIGQSMLSIINNHNKFEPSQEAFKNYVVRNIIATGVHPKNQISAHTPIDMGEYDNIKKEKEGNFFLWLGDGISMDQQQQTNATGKDVIGIAANGIKDYFSLVEYFSNYYKDDINKIDNEYFERTFNIGYLKDGEVINNKQVKVNRIGGLNLEKKATEILNTYLQNELGISNLFNPNSDPSLVLSSLLSASTDNAKELILKTINAGKEFASMHVYLIILGFNEGAIANFMTSKENLSVLNGFKHNIFYSDKNKPSADKVVNESKNTPTEFKKIYNLAKELTFLAKILKINQGIKASGAEIYLYFQNIQNEFIARENQLKSDVKAKKELTLEDILNDKPYLKNQDISIQKTLDLARENNISNGGFNISKFFEDEDYKKVAIDYYNLIKGTFNVVDTMTKLPHFGKMIEASKMVYDQLTETSKKFRFLPEIVVPLLENSNITNWKVNYKVSGTNSISLSEKQINNVFNTFDDIMITEWLKTIASNYNINLQDVKQLTNKVTNYFNGTRFSTLGNEDLMIDLNDPKSFINFKTMMESNIIPYLKQITKNEDIKNSFISGLVVRGSTKKDERTYLSTKLRPSVADNPKNLEIMEKYQEGFDALSNIDLKIGDKIYNPQDLLFIYNLIINKDRPGSDRLTIFFKNYVSNVNSESSSFYKFISDIDSDEIDIFTPENISKYKDAIIFGVLAENNELKKSSDHDSIILKYNNVNESLVTAISSSTSDLKYIQMVNTIMGLIKNNNILIKFNCE